MSLNSLFADLAQRLRSAEFLLHAVHPDHPTAFTRQRKLPLPALVALLLSGMRKSVQGELDEFFAHLSQRAQLVRNVFEQAFAQALAKLSLPSRLKKRINSSALQAINPLPSYSAQPSCV